jgi:hypothetical protein
MSTHTSDRSGGVDPQDTQIINIYPNYTGDSNLYFVVGNENSSGNGTYRGLMKFDLTPIPATAIIDSGKLYLYNYGDDSNNNRTMNLYRLKRGWTEAEATWNKYDGVNDWQTAGGSGADDKEADVLGSIALVKGAAAGYREINLDVAKLQSWIDGSFANNGFIAIMETEYDDMQAFRPSEYATVENRPYIVIEFSLGGNCFFTVI